MVWGHGGFLGEGLGSVDFAGGNVVHISSGVSGLVLSIILGKRRGYKTQSYRVHNVPFVVLGAAILYFGWFGFNAGSALGANGLAAHAFITTNTSCACAMLSWMFIPIESQIEKFQDEYYAVIAKCHVHGESTIFIEFMLSQIDKVLDEIALQVTEGTEQMTEYLKRMFDVMEYDVPYTSSAIMELLGLKSKETFRKNYMNPALKHNFVKMTLPDKPNSKNQRYIKY